MKVLAFDQGTLISGFAYFEGSDLVKHGVITANKSDEYWIRLQFMRNKIERMIKVYNPDYVVIEGIAMQRDQQALIKLGQLQGVIMGASFSNNIPVDILLPTHWRKLNGFKQGGGVKRADLKKQAFDMVQECYHLNPPPTEDEADAIAIGVAWLREREYLPPVKVEPTEKEKKKKAKEIEEHVRDCYKGKASSQKSSRQKANG
nr:MAG TPA: RuvC [Caudoviricetes sp.]